MATYVVQIGADGSTAVAEAARVEAALNKASRAGTQAGNQIADGSAKAADGQRKAAAAAGEHGDAISKLIHIAEAYFAIHKFEQLIDGYIETSNRIRAVSTDQANLNGLMDATFKVAQNTRSSWEDVASTYQRLGTVTKGLGLSQRDVINLTEEMAMAAKVGGATNREAGASMAELTHAFATGTLQGREFRVLMRDTPSLMKELQVASGHTGAEFAEMGKTSKITASMIVEWFGKADASIREKFGNTIPTIAEGFTQIENAARKFFGESAVGSGVMATLSTAMRFVADNFETFAKVALAVGEAIGTLFAIGQVIALVAGLAAGGKALAIAFNSGPIAALNMLAVAVIVGVSLLRQFGDQFETSKAIMTGAGAVVITVADDLQALWGQLKQLGSEIMSFVGEAWHALTGAIEDGINTKGIGDSLSGALRLVSGFVGGVRELFHMLSTDSDKAFAAMAYGLVQVMTDALNALMALFGNAFGKMRHMAFEFLDADERKDQMRRANVAAKTQFADDEASGRNARVRARVTADLGPGATQQAIDAEYQKRLNRDFEASRVEALNRMGRNADGSAQREGTTTIGHIGNPLDGTALAATAKSVIGDISAAANKSMEEFDAAARANAAKRLEDQRADKSTVNATRSTPDAVAEDDKAKRAREKLANELRGILEQTNPQVAAQEKLAHAQIIVNKAVAEGIVTEDGLKFTRERGAAAMADYTKKNEDALLPFDAFVRKQRESTDALSANIDEQERLVALSKFTEHMRGATGGRGATAAELAVEKDLIAAEQARAKIMKVEQSIYQETLGPQHQYELGLKAAGDLLHDQTINAEQYGRAVDKIRAAYLASSQDGKSFAGGLEAGWLKMKSDAESFGAVLAGQIISNLDKLNDALITAANGGEVSWSKMADAMVQDLERVLLKALEVAAITALLNSIAPGSGTAASSTGVSGAAADLFNNALGGGGTGSTSSAISMAPVMPTPSAAAPAARGGSAGFAAQAPVEVHIHQHQDGSSQGAYLTSRAGQQVINTTLRKLDGGMRQ